MIIFIPSISNITVPVFIPILATKVHDSTEAQGVADKLGISAIIVQDLKEKRQRNYEFSWDRMLSFTGDTGVFLQYTHARLCR